LLPELGQAEEVVSTSSRSRWTANFRLRHLPMRATIRQSWGAGFKRELDVESRFHEERKELSTSLVSQSTAPVEPSPRLRSCTRRYSSCPVYLSDETTLW